ncbi:hypothetical protein [Sphingopyxis panaciterrae]
MWRFDILAAAAPQTLPRITAAFAEQALVPSGARIGREGAMLRIEYFFDSDAAADAAVLTVTAALDAIAEVKTVAHKLLANGGRPPAPTFARPA